MRVCVYDESAKCSCIAINMACNIRLSTRREATSKMLCCVVAVAVVVDDVGQATETQQQL